MIRQNLIRVMLMNGQDIVGKGESELSLIKEEGAEYDK